MIETVLIIAISLVLVIVFFYPQLTRTFSLVMTSMDNWFRNAIAVLGSVVI